MDFSLGNPHPKYHVWALYIGSKSNRRIHSLYHEERDAKQYCDYYNKTFPRQNPAEVALIAVY